MTVTNSAPPAAPPKGYTISNLDPSINSTFNNEIYDANFIPGFQVGLTSTSISYDSFDGGLHVGYWIGPWSTEEDGLPHLAVGPQCCNFVEVPHTQQFRMPAWGDYYYVRAGFGPPGVNLQNYTSNFTTPAPVGLRTDWNWTVQLSILWSVPKLLAFQNEWAAVGIAATQYVANAPGKLVYSVINFWMDSNSSKGLESAKSSPSGLPGEVVGSNVVVYHPVQVSNSGNTTITLNLSPYLGDTLDELGLRNGTSQPLLSYVYLNVEGYNFDWNGTIWSFRVMTPDAPPTSSTSPQQAVPTYYFAGVLVGVGVVLAAGTIFFVRRRKSG